MSDTDSLALEGLRVLKREAELDAVAVKARNEALAEAIDMLEHPRPRRGRPRKENWQSPRMGTEIIELPARVDGGTAEATPEPESAA